MPRPSLGMTEFASVFPSLSLKPSRTYLPPMNIQNRPEIEKQGDILAGRALTQALTEAVAGSRDPHADTAAVGAILREHLAVGGMEIKRRFDADPLAAEKGR